MGQSLRHLGQCQAVLTHTRQEIVDGVLGIGRGDHDRLVTAGSREGHDDSLYPCAAQLSGWVPSMSVNPYSRARSAEVTECWFHRARSGSVASAAMARPT